jgi:hypothetical protein
VRLVEPGPAGGAIFAVDDADQLRRGFQAAYAS